MAYRNGTYVAFDGKATTDPTKSDIRYYGILQTWNKSKSFDFEFSDSHKKTHSVQDSSSIDTLKRILLERMKDSKNMLIILSEDTSWDRGLLNYEIEKAVDYYKIPLIIAYTGFNSIVKPRELESRWPKALAKRISNNTAKCIHIPFKQSPITSAVKQFHIHNTGEDVLTSPLTIYKKEEYKKWGLI